MGGGKAGAKARRSMRKRAIMRQERKKKKERHQINVNIALSRAFQWFHTTADKAALCPLPILTQSEVRSIQCEFAIDNYDKWSSSQIVTVPRLVCEFVTIPRTNRGLIVEMTGRLNTTDLTFESIGLGGRVNWWNIHFILDDSEMRR